PLNRATSLGGNHHWCEPMRSALTVPAAIRSSSALCEMPIAFAVSATVRYPSGLRTRRRSLRAPQTAPLLRRREYTTGHPRHGLAPNGLRSPRARRNDGGARFVPLSSPLPDTLGALGKSVELCERQGSACE